jgi:hypothetical protein
MKITDIIRGILDQVDQEIQQQARSTTAEPEVAIAIPVEEPPVQEPDLIGIIRQLAGVPPQTNHVNGPDEKVSPIGASFPGGDDMHSRKNPADIRTNAPSMYPNYQAK